MPDAQPRYLKSRCEGDVLILTVTVAELHGEALCKAVGQELLQAIAGRDRPRVVVDLEQVQYVASMGLAILVRLRRQILEQQGKMVLCGVTQAPADVFDATKLAGRDTASRYIFELAPDVPAALAQLAAPA